MVSFKITKEVREYFPMEIQQEILKTFISLKDGENLKLAPMGPGSCLLSQFIEGEAGQIDEGWRGQGEERGEDGR